MIAAQFDAVAAAAEGCDALVATGLMPAAAGARSVAEKLGIRYVSVTFQQLTLPSPHHPPLARPGRPFPPDVTDNRVLWDLDAQSINALFGAALNTHRASIGLPPVDNVRDYVFTDQPWLAADPILGPWQETPDLDVVQTGAWILPDERPLPAELVAFLDAGTPPVYVGFGSMPMRASKDVARVAIEAIRAQGRRVLVARGWADLALIDDRDDCFVVGEVNQQALFGRVAAVVHHGGAGTTTTAARAGAPQVVVPQIGGPAVLGRPGGRPGHRRGARRSDSDLRVPVGRAQDGPDPRDPRTSDRRGRHDPHRRGDGGREAAARRRLREPHGIVEPGKSKGHMSTQGYEDELRSERSYVAGLYARLDAERARVKGRYSAALRGPIDVQNGGTLVERDAEVRALAKEVKRLDVADNGLCFGRLDTLSGERSYIGRIGLFDEENEYEPLLLDWRAPAARAFYVATAASPENMRRRRQFHTRGRQVVDFTDEVLGRPGDASEAARRRGPARGGQRAAR